MKIKTEIIDSIFIVTFEGSRLDASFAQDFLTAMKGFIQKGHLDILLDLSTVEFVDSTGLGSIVRCLKEIDSRGQLVLCGVNEMVLNLLQLTRLDKIFIQAKDRREALTTLSWKKEKKAVQLFLQVQESLKKMRKTGPSSLKWTTEKLKK